jgi:hypothetical protein
MFTQTHVGLNIFVASSAMLVYIFYSAGTIYFKQGCKKVDNLGGPYSYTVDLETSNSQNCLAWGQPYSCAASSA